MTDTAKANTMNNVTMTVVVRAGGVWTVRGPRNAEERTTVHESTRNAVIRIKRETI